MTDEQVDPNYLVRALRDYFSPGPNEMLGPAGAVYAAEKTGQPVPLMLQKAEEPYRLQRIKAGLNR
jgi:hypothetical protein